MCSKNSAAVVWRAFWRGVCADGLRLASGERDPQSGIYLQRGLIIFA